MSNEIALHFRDAPWSDVKATLNYVAPRHPPKQTSPYRPLDGWLYPEGMHFVGLWQFSDYLKTYEPADIETLHRLLGGTPSCSLIVNFRLQTHYDVWTLEEIKTGAAKSEGKFLDVFRFG